MMVRSEEHTSELQSPYDLVCRLLLETATTESYTLSLHDALPIYEGAPAGRMSGLPEAATLTKDRDAGLAHRRRGGQPVSEASLVQPPHPRSGGCILHLPQAHDGEIGRAHV